MPYFKQIYKYAVEIYKQAWNDNQDTGLLEKAGNGGGRATQSLSRISSFISEAGYKSTWVLII